MSAGAVSGGRTRNAGALAAAPAGDARGAALRLIGAVLRERRSLDEALESDGGFAALDARDRALARNIAATTLRRLGEIDAILAACLDRPLEKTAAMVLDLLRVGACQLLFMRVPAFAAIDTAVDLAQRMDAAWAKGFVNAVLRRVDREGRAQLDDLDAARLDTPGWLWDSWVKSYGEETARAIALAHLVEAPLDLSAQGDPAAVAAAFGDGAALLPTGTIRIAHAERPVPELPGFAAGAWWVQDAGAALPARLLGPVAGKRILDLCAAPGGKTAQLAAAGAAVTAVDRADGRVDRLKQNLARLGLQARCVVADATRWSETETYDAVLLDAPCTSTGTIRRHPDVARVKSAQDVVALAAAQDKLLDAAAARLAPGGLLVYSVCSIQPEEGPERVASLLVRRPELRRVPIATEELGGLGELLDAAGDLRALPCHLAASGGIDGFYAARLERAR